MTEADHHHVEGLSYLDLSRSADYSSEYRSDLESALAAFERAVALDPSHLGAQRDRAFTLAGLERDAEAVGIFGTVLRLAPGDADAALGLGQSLARLRQHDAAVDAFDRVLAARGFDPLALFGRAAALTALERFEPALDAWNEVLGLGRTVYMWNEPTRARLARAICLARLDRPEALAAFREVFEIDREWLDPVEVGEALRLEAAQVAFRQYTEAHANEAATWRMAVELWRNADVRDEALAAYENLVRLAPDDALACFSKGEAQQAKLALWSEFHLAVTRLEELEKERSSGS